mgnify:FL=1
MNTEHIYFLIYLLAMFACFWIIKLSADKWIKENGLNLYRSDYNSPKETYTLKDWKMEMSLAKKGAIIICPWCERGSQYGARVAESRKYRACKYCGIFQNIDGFKEQARLAKCSCGNGSWTLNKEGKNCDLCNKYIKF